MSFCKHCAVTVTGHTEKCPLCQSVLVGDAAQDSDIFPYVPTIRYKHSLLYHLLLLCTAALVIVSVAINWMLPHSGYWSLFVIAGVACVWVSLSIAIRKRHNILKNLTYQVTIISLAALLWDILAGWHGWSVDFVIPIAFVSAMSTTAILARVQRINASSYIVYLALLILYGIIPVTFVISGLSNIVYPSIICVAVSLLSLITLVIFQGRDMKEELKRRLHL